MNPILMAIAAVALFAVMAICELAGALQVRPKRSAKPVKVLTRAKMSKRRGRFPSQFG